jgi:hypothetical protein
MEPFQDKGRPFLLLRGRGGKLRQTEQIRQQPVRQWKGRLPAEELPRKGLQAPGGYALDVR